MQLRGWMRAAVLTAVVAVGVGCGFGCLGWGQPIMSSKTVMVYQRPKRVGVTPTARVAALVRQLGDASAVKREAARLALEKMGVGIEPQLQGALEAEDAKIAGLDAGEKVVSTTFVRGFGMQRYPPRTVMPQPVRVGLSALIERCEMQRKAAVVTLEFDGATAEEVLREFGRQVGVDVGLMVQSGYRQPKEEELGWVKTSPMTIHLKGASYWTALREVLARLPVPNGDEQDLLVGNDRVPLAKSLREDKQEKMFALQEGPGTVVAGPVLVGARLEGSVLRIRAAVEPEMVGVGGGLRVKLEAVRDDLGHSLLVGEQRVFEPKDDKDNEYDSGTGRWVQTVKVPVESLGEGRRIAEVRGVVGVAMGPESQKVALPVGVPERLRPTAGEGKVYVLEDCEILRMDGGEGGPYRKDSSVCRGERAKDSARGRAGAEEQVMVLTNTGRTPETFVAARWLFGGVAEPKPFEVGADAAIYKVEAAPGETVRLRVGVRYERGSKTAGMGEMIPAEEVQRAELKDVPVELDGWSMRLTSVARAGELYQVSGELSRPKESPAGDEGIHLYVSLADGARWSIVAGRKDAERVEGDRVVESWTLTTREPGRVPATVLWDTPGETSWLEEGFRLGEVGVPAAEDLRRK